MAPVRASVSGLQAAFDVAGLGQVEELLLRRLDLAGGRQVEVVGMGGIDHLLADIDQLAAQMEIVDRAPVVLGIDDGDDGAGKPRQILRAAMLDQGRILVEQALQRQSIGDLAALDQLAGGLVDAAVQRVGEMIGPQELVDLVEDQVVGEDRAEQRHLGLVVVRRDARRDVAVPSPGSAGAASAFPVLGWSWVPSPHPNGNAMAKNETFAVDKKCIT